MCSSARCRSDERAHLGGGEYVDLAGVPHAWALDQGHRVGRQPVDLHRALEDSVEDDQVLLGRPVRARQSRAPVFDVLGRYPLDRRLAKGSVQASGHVPVVGEGARLDVAVVLHVAQPLGRRVGELRVDGAHARERAAAGVSQDRLQGLLGRAGRVVAGGGASALRPRLAEATLHLASISEAVLEVVDRPTGALAQDHVPAHVGVRNVRAHQDVPGPAK